MGFTAADAVIPFDYDFTGMVTIKGVRQRVGGWPQELYEVQGVTPEPSQEQVRLFQEALRRVYQLGEFAPDAEGGGDEVTGQELAEKVAASLSLTEITKRDEEIAGIYAAVCSNEPSAEQILLLPHRQRAAFIGYLSNELLNPTKGSAGTSR
jgi:hypothetical protein